MHRTGQIVHLPGRAGSRRAEADRSCQPLPAGRSSGHNLAGEGTEQLAGRHSSDMAVAGRIGLEELGSPAEVDSHLVEEGSPGRSRVAGSLGCSLVGRIDRT